MEGYRVYYHGFLKAHGQFISDAIGEAIYIPKNPKDSYGNAVEKAKSDCLVRCCKVLPLFRECWDKDYADYWRATYAHEVNIPNGNPPRQWRKHGSMTRNYNTKPGIEHEDEFRKPPRVEDENQQHMDAMRAERVRDAARAYVLRDDKPNPNAPLRDDFAGHHSDALPADYYDDARED